MSPTSKPLSGTRVGIFGKGGSGKSTITVLAAKALRKRGYEVCVLDADSTNVGLHRAFGLDDAPEPLVDCFGGMVFSGGAVTCPVDDPTPLPGAEIVVEDLPSRFVRRSIDGVWLLAAGKMGDRGPGAGCDGPMAKIARDLRLHLRHGECVTLLDFKAGFEDSARGVLVGLDQAVVVVDPTLAAVQMAIDLSELIDRIQKGDPPATAHLESPDLVSVARDLYRQARIQRVLVVLNRVEPKSSRHLFELLTRRGIHPVAQIRHDPSISESWLMGERLESQQAKREVQGLVDALEMKGQTPGHHALEFPVHPAFSY